MEIYKILPKDINIVLAFDIFKKINNRDKPKDKKYNNRQLRNMFIVAMQNLKYMGYVGATRQQTFLFKKNFFAKPSIATKQLKKEDKEKDDKELEKTMGNVFKGEGQMVKQEVIPSRTKRV